jgi:hypothetical protein
MTAISVSPVEVVAGVGVLVTLLWVWRAGARRARAAADAARSSARLVSLAGRVVQRRVDCRGAVGCHHSRRWRVVATGGAGCACGVRVVLVDQALTITTSDMPRRRGGGRR